MAGDKRAGRVAVAMLAPARGQYVFLISFQQGVPPDFPEITGRPLSARLANAPVWVAIEYLLSFARRFRPMHTFDADDNS